VLQKGVGSGSLNFASWLAGPPPIIKGLLLTIQKIKFLPLFEWKNSLHIALYRYSG
jgi:hypothetical protein